MGSSGQNAVQAGAFWDGYFLGECLFLEENIPDLGFLAYQMSFTCNYLEKPWEPTKNHEKP